MSYKVINNIIIFDWNFNKILDNEIIQAIKLCDTIYFNNYDNNNLCLETKNKFKFKYSDSWKSSKFNQPINNLPLLLKEI